jgi:hypothetical protein
MASGLAGLAVLLVLWLQTGKFYYSSLIGYYLGSLSFVVLIEGFVALEKAPAWFNVPALIFSNLKLLFIGLLVFVLSRLGFSVVEIVIGIFISQLAVLFSVVVTIYINHQTADKV